MSSHMLIYRWCNFSYGHLRRPIGGNIGAVVTQRSFSSSRRRCSDNNNVAIRSFNPAIIQEQNLPKISLGRRPTKITFAIKTPKRHKFSPQILYDDVYTKDLHRVLDKTTRRTPWPDVRGHFYYYRNEDIPFAGGLRFRTFVNDSDSWEDATDLDSVLFEKWHYPIVWLVRAKPYDQVLEKLLYDGCVDEYLVRNIKRLGIPAKALGKQLLFTPTQPIVMHTEWNNLDLHLVNPRSQGLITHLQMFGDPRGRAPYKGYVRLRFELSTLPEHKDSPTLFCRVLEVLTPLERTIEDYDGLVLEPKAGELLMRKKKSGIEPWSYALNEKDGGRIWKTFIASTWPSSMGKTRLMA